MQPVLPELSPGKPLQSFEKSQLNLLRKHKETR
jgi:hypothetical protein